MERGDFASEGGIALNFQSDLTPQERVDDGTLARLLGGCSCRESAETAYPDMMRREYGGVDEACGQYCSSGNPAVHGFGVSDGVLAAMYVPIQAFDDMYELETAISRGTLFRRLDKPFYGDGREENRCGKQR